jgi:SAM-dependent methyltransferase
MSEYVFDNKGVETATRFGALETLYDPLTIRHLTPYAVAGAQCLEVGGGSGSIARWMSERVGDGGRIVVTDLETRFLESLAAPNVEVRRHDIVTDVLETSAFDLAHTRLVLVHLPDRMKAIERMIAALKPGGWLVLQEFDSLSMPPDPNAFDEHLLQSLVVLWDVMKSLGVNLRFGRELFPLFRQLGLEDVEGEGHMMFHHGGSAGAHLMQANFAQVHDALIAGGMSEEAFREDMERLKDPAIAWPSQVMWTVRGRKR